MEMGNRMHTKMHTNGFPPQVGNSTNRWYNWHGGRSSAGRALDCDSSGRGFKPLRSPQFLLLPTKYPIKSYLIFSVCGRSSTG